MALKASICKSMTPASGTDLGCDCHSWYAGEASELERGRKKWADFFSTQEHYFYMKALIPS